MLNIVLCGGQGRKLWPLSQTDTPKQFLKFGNDESHFMKTIKRNLHLCDKTVVITDQKYSETADKQIMDAKIEADIILEPSGKNTAASIAMACLLYPTQIFLVTPSDHEIADTAAYDVAVKKAEKLAEEGHIALFGIDDQQPEKRFGYFKADGETVKHFHEKPDKEQAEKYLADGYLVNSGILCFNSCVMLREMLKFMPDQIVIAKTVIENIRSGRATHRLCGRFMGEMTNISIDHAVLEKSDLLKCVTDIKGWSDIGTFGSFYKHRSSDEEKNISLNIGDSFGCADFADSRGSMVINRDQDVVICGLDNVVVVEANGKILVAHKDVDVEQALRKLEE